MAVPYVSETGIRIPKITVKEEERRNRKGKQYFIYTIKVCGDTEQEVVETINNVKNRIKEKKEGGKKET